MEVIGVLVSGDSGSAGGNACKKRTQEEVSVGCAGKSNTD